MLSERGKESPDSRSVFLKIEMLVTDNADAEALPEQRSMGCFYGK